jgi:hypothetical protein
VVRALEIVSVALVALAMAPAVAHALELPGKLRLSREAYLTVQRIYYPGFTIVGGIAEVGGLAAIVLPLHAAGEPRVGRGSSDAARSLGALARGARVAHGREPAVAAAGDDCTMTAR